LEFLNEVQDDDILYKFKLEDAKVQYFLEYIDKGVLNWNDMKIGKTLHKVFVLVIDSVKNVSKSERIRRDTEK